MGDPAVRLLDLDTRHGELLDRLAVLDQQVNEVLGDWTRTKEAFQAEQQKRKLIFDREIESVVVAESKIDDLSEPRS